MEFVEWTQEKNVTEINEKPEINNLINSVFIYLIKIFSR